MDPKMIQMEPKKVKLGSLIEFLEPKMAIPVGHMSQDLSLLTVMIVKAKDL